jgi:hypothetical protein
MNLNVYGGAFPCQLNSPVHVWGWDRGKANEVWQLLPLED